MKFLAYMLAFFTVAPAGHALAQDFTCGSDKVNRDATHSNKAFAHAQERYNQMWADYRYTNKRSKLIVSTPGDTSYQIPVVVHIVHSGEAIGTMFNPSDAAIDSFINYLNQSWAATWSAYPNETSGGVKIKIQFALAKRTPDCNPTNGIIRVNGSLTLPQYAAYGINYNGTTPAPRDSEVKALSIWPREDYYNIWIVKYIDGPAGTAAAAYAFYPGGYRWDGTVIAAKYVFPIAGWPGIYYEAIPHELGHAFWLKHTFEGDDDGTECPPNGFCDLDGDGVCDTQPHKRSTGCPVDPNPCTGGTYNNVQYNFMNYSTCGNRFTTGQRERVMFSLKTMRQGLINSIGDEPPAGGTTPLAPVCKPGIVHAGNDLNIGPCNISLSNLTATSYGYSTDDFMPYMDKTCVQKPAELIAGQSYPLSVTTTNIEKVRVWIDYNNDGAFIASERVMSHNGTMVDETHTTTLVVPSTGIAKGLPIRMRVVSDIITAVDPTSCSDLQYGQAEDYAVIIRDASAVPEVQSFDAVKVYPNPSDDIVYIQTIKPLNLFVYSMDGKLVMQQPNATQLDISNLARGLYILTIEDSDSHQTKMLKLMKGRN